MEDCAHEPGAIQLVSAINPRSNAHDGMTQTPEAPRVALVVFGDSVALAPLEQRLLADAAEVERWSASIVLGHPPSSRVVVVLCMPPRTPSPPLRELVAWAERGSEPVGLIAYVPQGTTEDAERALECGFDDVIAGRDSPRELSARVRAVGRRSRRVKHHSAERLEIGRVVLDLARHELLVGRHSASLTPLELLLMRALIEAGGRPLSREQLLSAVWGTEDVGPRAVDNLVWRLRRKLGGARVFSVVRGVGFRLIVD